MALNFNEARDYFKNNGFYLINHVVVIYHMLKEFTDFDVIKHRFYIIPVGKDFLHVALIQYEYGMDGVGTLIRYTCAGDDLLYGLRNKYNSGGSKALQEDINEIVTLVASGNLRTHDRYIPKRFRHGRTKAKIRALLMMIKEQWLAFFSFK